MLVELPATSKTATAKHIEDGTHVCEGCSRGLRCEKNNYVLHSFSRVIFPTCRLCLVHDAQLVQEHRSALLASAQWSLDLAFSPIRFHCLIHVQHMDPLFMPVPTVPHADTYRRLDQCPRCARICRIMEGRKMGHETRGRNLCAGA